MQAEQLSLRRECACRVDMESGLQREPWDGHADIKLPVRRFS